MIVAELMSQTVDEATCISCGYSLRGLPEHRCPECGNHSIPPTLTMRCRASHWLLRWLARPPGVVTVSLPWLAVRYASTGRAYRVRRRLRYRQGF